MLLYIPAIMYTKNFNPVVFIIYVVVLIAEIFVGLKLFRKNYKIAGVIILCLSIPIILGLLLFGGCFVMINGL